MIGQFLPFFAWFMIESDDTPRTTPDKRNVGSALSFALQGANLTLVTRRFGKSEKFGFVCNLKKIDFYQYLIYIGVISLLN